ncbi:Longevity-assurance protein (LAC1) [Phytophthora palmivora]|uniref:Longevity-assurance protein (LAC1) n=1 Tax=Phytophthora palmivora TaxID=4796 RepID=A0A2P4XKG8_9STRA|nr:Longevity-assurance protein (LAC1) [Phytophthora palmivora]
MGRSIPKPNPVLDTLLVGLLVCELGIITHTLWDDKQMLYILVAMFFVVALAVKLTKTSFAIGGGWFSRTFLHHLGDPLKKAVTMKKWCDQSWQLVIHVTMTIFELYVLRDETWWQDTTTLWNQGTDTGVFPTQKFSTKLLYITQLAIWIYTAFSCKFLEEIRKDYLVMMTHHVVTIALVTWSYAVGFLPVGVVVLLLHDMTDIPLDMLKMANYLKMEGAQGLFTSEILFVTTIVLWFYYRIYQYPTKLLYTTMVENREASMTMADAHDFTQLFPHPGPPSWLLFNVLLTTLYCLHIWWGLLLVRVLIGVVTKGAHDTAKEEYEGTSSDSDNENKDD